MQARRIQEKTTSEALNGQTETTLDVPSTPREMINFHNIWVGVAVNPASADANASGVWVLYVRRAGDAAFQWTSANLNGEVKNVTVIACGLWKASNQTPFNMPPLQIGTSRNLNPGDDLHLGINVHSISTGTAEVSGMLCAHTTRK